MCGGEARYYVAGAILVTKYSLDLRGPPGVQEEGGDGAEAVEQAL